MLVFVEVRLRRSAGYGGAVASITARKRARLVAAANGYLAMLGREPPCRFDAILMSALDPATIEWRKDVVGVD
jgi:putative endonuclease